MHDIQKEDMDQIFGGITSSGRQKKQIDDDYKLYPVPYPRNGAGTLDAAAASLTKSASSQAGTVMQAPGYSSSSLQRGGKLQHRPPRYMFNLLLNSSA